MATKSYSKHKEYREYSSSGSGSVPGYTDEQFDMIKSDLLPKGSKLNSLDRTGGAGTREYHYEYKEEKHPSGKFDRKDLHTVELMPKGCKLERTSPGRREYCYDYEDKSPRKYDRNDPDMFAVEEFTVPPRTVPKSSETSSYYYEKEERELPSIGTGTRTYNYESSTSATPGYSKVKTSKATKDLSQNVEELDSLLDDLQKDQDRQLYKSGYTSDTAESTSFDYRKGTPVRPAPSSGYSTLKREEHVEKSSWSSSPPPPPTLTRAAEVRQEVYREEKTESRVVPSQVSPALPIAVPQPVCHHCHHVTNTGTLSRSSTPMNKVTTTVKTYTYEVPADQDPAAVPLPAHPTHQRTYLSTEEDMRTTSTLTKSGSPRAVPAPVAVPASPAGCQYCSHCNSHIREYTTHHTTSTDVTDRSTNERMVYPSPANETKLLPPTEPLNGHGPYGPTTYKYSETSYSSSNTHEYPRSPTGRSPHPPTSLSPSPAPFPRPSTPSPGNQQPPKRLDDLMADFPEAARFPTQPDGITRRKVEMTHESQQSQAQRDLSPTKPAPAVGSKNVAGPAVYYPPGHTPFAKKDTPVGGGGGYEASSAMAAGGGRYASGRGMYEYESGSRSKEKHSETKTAVPICLPLCCAMPCVIM